MLLARELQERLLEPGAGDLEIARGREALSKALIARSESEQTRITDSPRSSTLVTPGSRSSCSAGTVGSVARIVREPTMALISVGGPSATIDPRAMSTIRSA